MRGDATAAEAASNSVPNDGINDENEGGFSETLKEVARHTPKDRLVDYKLVWRDPIPTWLSKSKKLAVMGDAAHCHLPTSAQGACQAVEDAVCMVKLPLCQPFVVYDSLPLMLGALPTERQGRRAPGPSGL